MNLNEIDMVLWFFDVEFWGLVFNLFGYFFVCVCSKKDKCFFVECYDRNIIKV